MAKTFEVRIRFKSSKRPVILDALDTYVKEGMFCIRMAKPNNSVTVKRYPICNIWDIEEDE